MIRNTQDEAAGGQTKNARRGTKKDTYNGPRTEADVRKMLHLDKKEILTAKDHQKIADAVRPLVRPLRKSDPKLAAHLYYIYWRHNRTAKSEQSGARGQQRQGSRRSQRQELAAAA